MLQIADVTIAAEDTEIMACLPAFGSSSCCAAAADSATDAAADATAAVDANCRWTRKNL